MGYYLNGTQAFSVYKSESRKPYFVDKTEMLTKLIPLVEQGNNHVCITRPRRFGKSIMAAMIGAFFGRGTDSSDIFDTLKIAQDPQNEGSILLHKPGEADKFDKADNSGKLGKTLDYRRYMNQYNVIYINFIEAANESTSRRRIITVKWRL